MVDLFYESELGQTVSAQEIDGKNVLVVKKSEPPVLAETPTISRTQLAISNDDVYVIDSLRSGTPRTESSSVYGRVLRPLLTDVLDVKHSYLATQNASAIGEFAAGLKALSRPVTLVVIAGDTSIGELANALSLGDNSNLRILVVPAGTGNSLALSIGISDEIAAVKKLVLFNNQSVKPLNWYEVKFPSGSAILHHDGTKKPVSSLLFVVVASWAFHASLVADSDTDEMRKHGIDRFKIAAGQNLARPQKYEGSFEIVGSDGFADRKEGPFAYFVVTPSKKFEPTFEILPRGNIFDSNLYVVGLPTEDDDKYIMDVMMEVYDGGKHVDNPKVIYDLVKKHQKVELKVKNGKPEQNRRFCVDGAIVVLPEQEESEVTFAHHGPIVNGWNVSLIC